MSTDPDTLVDIQNASSEVGASVLVEALKAEGVPAFSVANAGAWLQWEVLASQPFRISVRRQDVEKARKILQSIKADSVDIDWNEVDVGAMADAPAPQKLPRFVKSDMMRTAMLVAGLGLVVLWMVLNARNAH